MPTTSPDFVAVKIADDLVRCDLRGEVQHDGRVAALMTRSQAMNALLQLKSALKQAQSIDPEDLA